MIRAFQPVLLHTALLQLHIHMAPTNPPTKNKTHTPSPIPLCWMMPMAKGWNTVSLRLSAPLILTENVSLIPWVGANLPLEALEMHQNNKFAGGIALSATF